MASFFLLLCRDRKTGSFHHQVPCFFGKVKLFLVPISGLGMDVKPFANERFSPLLANAPSDFLHIIQSTVEFNKMGFVVERVIHDGLGEPDRHESRWVSRC